jgi:hypothetical protein
MSREERLAYYQEKYGENFEKNAASFTETGGGKRAPRRGEKSGRPENASRGKQKTKSGPRQPPLPQPNAKPQEEPQKEAKTPGLLRKFLGLFTKKE